MKINNIFSGKKEEKKKSGKSFMETVGRIIVNLARHPLLYSFFLFIISLAIGGVFFYKYLFLAENIKPLKASVAISLEEGAYQKILQTWQEQEKVFNEADTKTYIDPFRSQSFENEEIKK